MWMLDATYKNPELLWLLILVPLVGLFYFLRKKPRTAHVVLPHIPAALNMGFLPKLRPVLVVLQLAAMALVIVALARPQSTATDIKKRGAEGIDIMLAVDISPSMLSKDLRPNRLEALKVVAQNFVDARSQDRLGLVIYAGEAFAQVPITTDHKVVKNALKDLKYDLLDPGTAIGMGLSTAANRLKDSEAKSKVIILLTDGENNKGIIDPKTAADFAKQLGIRVYTIGVGTTGFAETPVALDMQGNFVYRNMQVSIDEELLKYIAQTTNGKYFRATNNQSLQNIYAEIDQLEKTKVEELAFYSYTELFRPLILWAFGLLLLSVLLRFTIYKSMV